MIQENTVNLLVEKHNPPKKDNYQEFNFEHFTSKNIARHKFLTAYLMSITLIFVLTLLFVDHFYEVYYEKMFTLKMLCDISSIVLLIYAMCSFFELVIGESQKKRYILLYPLIVLLLLPFQFII